MLSPRNKALGERKVSFYCTWNEKLQNQCVLRFYLGFISILASRFIHFRYRICNSSLYPGAICFKIPRGCPKSPSYQILSTCLPLSLCLTLSIYIFFLYIHILRGLSFAYLNCYYSHDLGPLLNKIRIV